MMLLQRNVASSLLQNTRSGLAPVSQVRAFSSAIARSLPPFEWHEPHADDTLQFNPEDVFRAGVRHHHRCNTAYPISHNTTIRPYRVPRLRDQEAMKRTLENAYGYHKDIMLYVHVPFCQTRCQFCEYTVVNPKVGKVQDTQTAYFDALMDEFKLYDDLLKTSEKRLVGFDIGGGTPSMASIADIERVMNAARKHFNLDVSSMEVSIETTPKIAANEPDKIKAYYDMGIRRISMGLQTTDFKQAKDLGRDDANAGADYLRKAIENIRKAGFQSFNIDLMYGFPLRPGKPDPWGDTVRDCIALQPEHITLYRMRYKGTSMEHLADRVDLAQVNEQEALARQILLEAGYQGATGKNTFSRLPGSSGCSDYLDKRVVKAVPYIGLGLGAQSFSHHTLSYNLGAVTKKLEQYVRSCELGRIPIQDIYHLSKRAAIAKMISVSFYFGGIDLEAFKQCFGETVFEVFPNEVQFVLEKELMTLEDGRLQLTTIGKKHFGGVIALFYSPSVQKHVINLAGGELFERDPLALINDKLRASKLGVEKPATPVLHTPPPSTSSVWPLKSGSEIWTYNHDTKSWTEVSSRTFSTSSLSENTIDLSTVKKPLDVMKNDTDSHYEFGNLLFGGACNQKCPFCIGKQLDPQLTPDNLRLWPPRNLDGFIEKMRSTKTKKLIFTGTRTDPQLYKYEEKLLDHMRTELPGIHVSLHTNGLLALRKIDVFNKYDTVTISLNSFKPDTYAKLHGTKQMPDLGEILKQSKIPVKLSCVLTKENVGEVDEYLAIATALGVKRIAFRHLFNDSTRWPALFSQYTPSKFFCGNPVYTINGVEVTYWVFDKTTGKSLNLFSDGTVSEDYLLAKAPGNLNSSSSFLSISNHTPSSPCSN